MLTANNIVHKFRLYTIIDSLANSTRLIVEERSQEFDSIKEARIERENLAMQGIQTMIVAS